MSIFYIHVHTVEYVAHLFFKGMAIYLISVERLEYVRQILEVGGNLSPPFGTGVHHGKMFGRQYLVTFRYQLCVTLQPVYRFVDTFYKLT